MFRAKGKALFNRVRVMPAMMERMIIPSVDLQFRGEVRQVVVACNRVRAGLVFYQVALPHLRIDVIPVSRERAFEVPSLAEQHEISFAGKEPERSKLVTIAETILPAPIKPILQIH